MTVLLSIPSRQYTPQTVSQTVSVAQAATKMVLTLTRESWSVGPVGSISIFYPDGSLATASAFNGGDQTDYRGNLITQQAMVLYGKSIGGVMQALATGLYRFEVQVLQTLTTAVVVERF